MTNCDKCNSQEINKVGFRTEVRIKTPDLQRENEGYADLCEEHQQELVCLIIKYLGKRLTRL